MSWIERAGGRFVAPPLKEDLLDINVAKKWRREVLEETPSDPEIIEVRLESPNFINPSAAKEGLGKWLLGLEVEKDRPIIVVATSSYDILQSIHYMLMSIRRATYVETEGQLLKRLALFVRARVLPSDKISQGEPTGVIGELVDTDWETLLSIRENGSLTSANLSKRLGITPQAAGNHLAKLVSVGMVKRFDKAGRTGDLFSYPFKN